MPLGTKSFPKADPREILVALRDLGETLRAQRLSLGLTQEALAERLSVSTLTVRYIENGQRAPSFAVLICLLKHLKISIQYRTKSGSAKRR